MLPDLSTARVLTTELVSGSTWEELLTWDQHERDLAGECLFRFVFRSLYGMHEFNGDPHPGNYLFHGDGRVTFLDFGLVKHFTDTEIATFVAMVRAAAYDHDATAFRRVLERAGMLRPGAPATDDEVGEYFSQFYEAVRFDQPVTWSSAYSSRIVRHTFDRIQPDRPVRHGAAGVRVHPADQPRAVRPARRAGRHGQLPAHRRGAVAVRRRPTEHSRWPSPSSPGSALDGRRLMVGLRPNLSGGLAGARAAGCDPARASRGPKRPARCARCRPRSTTDG